jgi:hypothetical protein
MGNVKNVNTLGCVGSTVPIRIAGVDALYRFQLHRTSIADRNLRVAVYALPWHSN